MENIVLLRLGMESKTLPCPPCSMSYITGVVMDCTNSILVLSKVSQNVGMGSQDYLICIHTGMAAARQRRARESDLTLGRSYAF